MVTVFLSALAFAGAVFVPQYVWPLVALVGVVYAIQVLRWLDANAAWLARKDDR